MREVARLLLPSVRWDTLRGIAAVWPTVERALDAGVGGFVLDNIPARAAAELTQRIRDRADEAPLLVVDPTMLAETSSGEAGFSLPPLAAVAAIRDTHAVRRAARATARAVRRFGGNMMLAPSGDVVGAPRTDAFGADPGAVALAVAEWIDAAQAEGVLCCAGGFPGAGRVASVERSIPVVQAAEDALYATDLVPFRAAIDAGVAAISLAVASYPSLDRTAAAAPFSARVINRVLRGELGFDGLVIADGGLLDARAGRPVPVCDLASAGVDLVVRSARLDVELRALLDAVEHGRLHRERVHDASSRRRTRAELAGAPLPLTMVPHTDDADWLEELAERTIAVIRGRAVHIEAPIELAVVGARPDEVSRLVAAVGDGVGEAGGDASDVRHISVPSVASRSAVVVVAADDSRSSEWRSRAAVDLAAFCAHARRARRDVAVVWCGHPDATPQPVDADLVIACWSSSGAMLRASGRWLMRRL